MKQLLLLLFLPRMIDQSIEWAIMTVCDMFKTPIRHCFTVLEQIHFH